MVLKPPLCRWRVCGRPVYGLCATAQPNDHGCRPSHHAWCQSTALHRSGMDHQPNHYASDILFHLQSRCVVDGYSSSILPL
ncbi:fused lipid transporter subunits of ABC superfamily: membrane component/ATP-binding component [Vibrio paracholerae]|nr:fused lipid transporter subunits of ABC superfamily: membrane component/ATP-binding component [Vibrio paracholerae]